MSALENFTGKFKQFKPTTWSIKNKTSIYLLMIFITLAGVYQFMTLPKEQFPDIVIPTIYVQTIYVGQHYPNRLCQIVRITCSKLSSGYPFGDQFVQTADSRRQHRGTTRK